MAKGIREVMTSVESFHLKTFARRGTRMFWMGGVRIASGYVLVCCFGLCCLFCYFGLCCLFFNQDERDFKLRGKLPVKKERKGKEKRNRKREGKKKGGREGWKEVNRS